MLKLLMTAALVLAPVAAVAAPVTWECSYSKRAASGWIGEQATYVIDEATQTATAFDPHIKFANKKPGRRGFPQKIQRSVRSEMADREHADQADPNRFRPEDHGSGNHR